MTQSGIIKKDSDIPKVNLTTTAYSQEQKSDKILLLLLFNIWLPCIGISMRYDSSQ